MIGAVITLVSLSDANTLSLDVFLVGVSVDSSDITVPVSSVGGIVINGGFVFFASIKIKYNILEKTSTCTVRQTIDKIP